MCLAIFPAIFLRSIDKNRTFLPSQVRQGQNQQVRRYLKYTFIWAYVLGTSDRNFCVNPTSSFFSKNSQTPTPTRTSLNKKITKKITIQPRHLQKNSRYFPSQRAHPHGVLLFLQLLFSSFLTKLLLSQNLPFLGKRDIASENRGKNAPSEPVSIDCLPISKGGGEWGWLAQSQHLVILNESCSEYEIQTVVNLQSHN